MERSLKPVSCVSVMQAGTLGRPACAMHADRRRSAFRPQAGKILAGQVIQDSLDHRWVFDGGDDLDRAPTFRTGLHINPKDPLEAQRSGCRQGRFAFCARSPWLKPRPRVPIASPSVAQPVCGLRFGLTLWASYPKPRRAGVIRARWGLLGANTRATASLPYCLRCETAQVFPLSCQPFLALPI